MPGDQPGGVGRWLGAGGKTKVQMTEMWTSRDTGKGGKDKRYWDPRTEKDRYATYYISRRDIFYSKSAKIFRRGRIISEDQYEEFRLTRTREHKGTLTSLLKKENSEKVDHPHRLFFSLFGSGLFK